MHRNPIVIVEDDTDDCEFLAAALRANGITNEFRCFRLASEALDYLKGTLEKPFLIISDISMPGMNGLEFKEKINSEESLKYKKLIPFVFLSTASDAHTIKKAFELSAQGYFKKPNNHIGLKTVARSIIEYWQASKLPPSIN